jgi:hypothetical protein
MNPERTAMNNAILPIALSGVWVPLILPVVSWSCPDNELCPGYPAWVQRTHEFITDFDA